MARASRRGVSIIVSVLSDIAEFLPAVLALLAAGLVKGITGIGYATCAMPLLAMAVGIEKALALVVVPALVSNVAVLIGGGGVVRTLVRFQRFYLAILPGIAVGTMMLGLVDADVATKGLALLTLAYVAMAVAKPAFALPPRLERPLAMPAGLVNGMLTGLTGSQIVPLVPYMMALRLDATTQVLAINLAVTIASVALGGALALAGIMTMPMLALSVAGAVPAIAGTLIGNVLRGWMPVESVRRLTLVVLVIAAIGLGGREAIDAALVAVGLAGSGSG
jgi:uncharacterized membrane protein YfcA